MAFVEFRDVRKTYQMGEVQVDAVAGVTFDIEQGELAVIVGPSGAGKTSVLNMLGGMDSCTSGVIKLDGKEISSFSEKQLTYYRRYDIGFVFQFYNLVQNLTALENVELPLIYRGMPREERRRLAQEALVSVGLEKRMDHRPGEMSGGQQQRVAIARALTMEPELLVADEPIASLDASIQAQIVNLFRHLQKEHGFSFLFIAHDLDMVEFLCDRVGVMYHGKLVETGPARAVFENPLHPYTKALIAAIPIPDPRRERARAVPDFSNTEFPRTGTLREVEKDHFVLMEGGDAG